jgi:nitrogen regulation protein NR(I)
MSRILVVDDDTQLRDSFRKLLMDEGYTVDIAPDGESALDQVRLQSPDLVVMDVRMPGMSGLETFSEMRKTHPRLPVIIMTAFGTTDTAIEATKLGAFDYVLKPFEIPDILSLIREALEAGRMMRSRVGVGEETGEEFGESIIGSSAAMQDIYKAIGRVAPTDATVLVLGESGTGKELVARAIYQHSARANKPFLVINCVAIPETLLESELFGYEKGAFTGASQRKLGRIEQAHGGTVFLDEIGDMPLHIQTKILRLLQEQSIERLGGGETISVDVRIIAATNRDLVSLMEQGRFREDLYYRLKVVTINLPPLRRREGDALRLCDYYLARYAREMGIDNPGMTPAARMVVEGYSWPGNVRELANAVKKALIFSRGSALGPDDLMQAMEDSRERESVKESDLETEVRGWVRKKLLTEAESDVFNHLMDRFGAILTSEALGLTRGNRTRAAKLLGVTRPTLQAKIEKYGLGGDSGHDRTQ